MKLSSSTKRWGGASAAAGAAVLAIGFTLQPAAAQSATPTKTPVTSSAPKSDKHAGTLAKLWESVAAKLGVGTDRVRNALAETEKDAVKSRVADGKLTKDQADRILQAIDQRGPGAVLQFVLRHRGDDGKGEHRKAERGKPGRAGEEVIGAVAQALGLQPREVRQELHQGKSLAEIGAARGKSAAQLEDAIRASVRQRLDVAVASGKLTKDQADRLFPAATSRLDQLLMRKVVPAKSR